MLGRKHDNSKLKEMRYSDSGNINYGCPPSTNSGITIDLTLKFDEINKKIMEELLKPKPIFVAFATVDGPSLTKVIYR